MHCIRVVVVAAILAATTCCEDPQQGPPNILFVSVDTLRADHLGCYGYARPTSPSIDALARRGVVYDDVMATSSWTLPSHASMLTGRYPAFHGLQDDGTKLPPDVASLAEKLRDHGYRSIAVVSHVYVSSSFGLERGFESFDDSLIEGGADNPSASDVVGRFLELIDKTDARPFFGFVHFFDPHWDYAPPPPFGKLFSDSAYAGSVDGTYSSLAPFARPHDRMPEVDRSQALALYDGEIAYVDNEIGRLILELERRGRMGNTVVVVTSDHGEEFKEHGRLGHGRTLYGEQLRVPLIVAGHRAFPRETRSEAPVSLVDLAPTLLELAGADPLQDADGVSLLAESHAVDRVRFAESKRFGLELRAARWGPHKIIRDPSGRELLFNVMEDPGEQRSLGGEPVGAVVRDALDHYEASADSGWHLKVIAFDKEPLTLRATIRAEEKIVNPRRYFSGNIAGRKVRFSEFRQPDERTLVFEATVKGMLEIVFDTTTAAASVRFEFAIKESDRDAGVFLGQGTRVASDKPLILAREDRRARGLPDYANAETGIYIRSVIPPETTAAPTQLSDEAMERLRSLGYVE